MLLTAAFPSFSNPGIEEASRLFAPDLGKLPTAPAV
jgi:hypothetical protein